MLAHLCGIKKSDIPEMLLIDYFTYTDFVDAYLAAQSK
jgi:hypothetical protein